MTTTMQRPEVRTYGGWRRSRGVGLFGLGPTSTLVVLGSVLAVILAASISLLTALALTPVAAVIIGSVVVRINGLSLADLLVERLRWWWAVLRGYTSYRAGVMIDHPRAWQLPGVLAPTQLLTVEDGFGGHYGLVWDQRTGLLTATLRCASTSTWLANPGDADTWVANWGGWLASLGYLPMVRWVTVTTDTAPDPGSTLTDTVAERISPTAPTPARELLDALVQSSPRAAADVDTRVSITFDPQASAEKPRDLAEAVGEVGRLLTGLQSSLASCGVTVLGRASAAALAGIVRTAFDPNSRGEVNRLLETNDPTMLTWADAGPIAAEEYRDHYEHDSGISVSWAWQEAPRQAVRSDVLARLVAPGLHAKRVTLLYRPFSAGDAARVLQNQVNAAQFRAQLAAKQGRDATARDVADRQRAEQAAAEEASGAGVCLVSLYLTVTVTEPDELRKAIADAEARADTAKIRLRRMWRSQAAGFAVTLPCGVCPPFTATRWSR